MQTYGQRREEGVYFQLEGPYALLMSCAVLVPGTRARVLSRQKQKQLIAPLRTAVANQRVATPPRTDKAGCSTRACKRV